ncbi:MAG TPA: hypothetical protein VHZ64_09405 [Xanthobacteraceae bacterium]|jgi:hypothetical protein|nr:hypothetical protein [Xanthobacteraceae bacterium]
MTKFLIGVATAALWFALSHAANAERICRQVCDNGNCGAAFSARIQRWSFATASTRGITTTLMPTRRPAMS